MFILWLCSLASLQVLTQNYGKVCWCCLQWNNDAATEWLLQIRPRCILAAGLLIAFGKALAKLVKLCKNGCWLQPAEATIEVNPVLIWISCVFKIGFDHVFLVFKTNDVELGCWQDTYGHEAFRRYYNGREGWFNRVSMTLFMACRSSPFKRWRPVCRI